MKKEADEAPRKVAVKVVEDVRRPAKDGADEAPGQVAVKVVEDLWKKERRRREAGARAWRRYNRRDSLDLWAM